MNLEGKTISLKGLPMEGLIGGPLMAASKANGMMAQQQADFLMKYCFTQQGDTYHPIMIQMSLTKSAVSPSATPGGPPSVEQVITAFELPLISIIPINSLAVESIEVDFHMEVTSHIQATVGGDEGSGQGPFQPQKAPNYQLIGYVGSQPRSGTRSASEHYRMDSTSQVAVSVKAGNLPLPRGLNTLLDLFSKSIQPVQVESKNDSASPE